MQCCRTEPPEVRERTAEELLRLEAEVACLQQDLGLAEQRLEAERAAALVAVPLTCRLSRALYVI